MKTAILLFLCSVLAVLVGFTLTYQWEMRHPTIDIPGNLDIGVQDVGRVVIVPITISNRGASALEVDRFSSSCGCVTIGLKQEQAGDPVTRLSIPPHGRADLTVTIAIRGQPGTEIIETVYLHTNDPKWPIAKIDFKATIQGTVITIPSEIVLGQVPPGEVSRHSVKIQDNGRKRPFRLKEIRSTLPDYVVVEEITPAAKSLVDVVPRELYTVTIVCRAPARPQRVEGYLEIIEENEASVSTRVRVIGEVVPRIALLPQSIVLPRRSDKGLVYSMRTMCRAIKGESFRLSVTHAPSELRVTLTPVNDTNSYIIDVESVAHPQPVSGKYEIILSANGPSLHEKVILPVRFLRTE